MNHYITYQNRIIDVISATIETDTGSYCWKANFVIGSYDDFLSLSIGTAIVANIFGDEFYLIINSLDYSRNGNEKPSLQVTAISPAITMAELSDVVFSGSYTGNTFSEVINTVFADYQFGFDWTLPVYNIPLGAVNYENSTPIDIANDIVNRLGGVVNSLRNGRLVARKKYQTSPRIITHAITGLELSADDDILSIGVQTQKKQGKIKQITIYSTKTEPFLSVELDNRPNGFNGGETTFYPGKKAYFLVWSNSQVYITGDLPVTNCGRTRYQIVDIITFSDGYGQTSKPCYGIVNAFWSNGSPAGLTLNSDNPIDLYCENENYKNSVCTVTYNTNPQIYYVQIPFNEITQGYNTYIYSSVSIEDGKHEIVLDSVGKIIDITDTLLYNNALKQLKIDNMLDDMEQMSSITINCVFIKDIDLTQTVSFTIDMVKYIGNVRSIRHTVDFEKALTQIEIDGKKFV